MTGPTGTSPVTLTLQGEPQLSLIRVIAILSHGTKTQQGPPQCPRPHCSATCPPAHKQGAVAPAGGDKEVMATEV